MTQLYFGITAQLPTIQQYNRVFPKHTNLTFLAFLSKIDIKGFQNQQKIKLPPVGIELTTPSIYGLQNTCLFHSATQTC